ncbi:NAD(P)-binding domain-containing protein [Kineococcus aurantiacus]|uniref:3-hydroxyisobutyrate dehydrogenase n=1 Tax=Kineococcus aurantiacus TaxID=37633 RepID=A0A7Y9J1E0_9ACTN|nr:3-hydroxyisobutyrate dehydrogenase [Kineococcus aurantiacus]
MTTEPTEPTGPTGPSDPTTTAFLGLGRMGRVLAGHLLEAGHDLRVWNRTPGRDADLVAAGAASAPTAADAVAGAGVVVTALFGPAAVREVVLDGLDLAAGTLWVDITTISPADADEHAAWAAARGVDHVHAPVVGSLGPAAARALGVLAGGPRAERAVPLVSLWADPDRLQVLPTAAAAATGKLVANLALAVSFQGLVEAVRLGSSGGLDLEQVLTTLKGTALGPIAAMKGANLRSGEFGDTQFSTDLLLKDTGLVLATSRYPLPALTVAAQALLAAQRAGDGDADFSAVARDEPR